MDYTYLGSNCKGTLSNIETTREEIIEICKDININKASCVNNVSREVLRDF